MYVYSIFYTKCIITQEDCFPKIEVYILNTEVSILKNRMANLNEDIIALILNEIGNTQHLTDALIQNQYAFMSASSEIHTLSAKWRKQYWSLGNIQLKPYQLTFGNCIECGEMVFVHEDKELNMLLLALSRCEEFSKAILIKHGDETKWSRLLREIGLNSDDGEYFSADIRTPIGLYDSPTLNLRVNFQDKLAYDGSEEDSHIHFIYECNSVCCGNKSREDMLDTIISEYIYGEEDCHINFIDCYDDANNRTIARDLWIKPTIVFTAIYDFETDLFDAIVSMMETKHELAIIDAPEILTERLMIAYDVIIDNDVYECDSDRILPINKTIYVYYNAFNINIGIDNVVNFSIYTPFIKNSQWKRTVNLTNYYYNFDVAIKKYEYLYHVNPCKHTISLINGYKMANLLRLEFFKLSDADKLILSIDIGYVQQSVFVREYYQKHKKDSALSEAQIKALTYLPVNNVF
jgi:hypothetical protein